MLKPLKNTVKNHWFFIKTSSLACILYSTTLVLGLLSTSAQAVMVEFNSTGGTTATDGLHIYIDDSTQIQVRRLNNTGQVYEPNTLPPSTNLDNGIFLRANGLVYGPDHNVTTFAPTGGMYSTRSITATSPANPSTVGDQQTATHNFGITSGPQVTVVWKYTTALDFLTAEVTLVIPSGYAVSAANPVRYYHVFDTYLGGSDNGCGFQQIDSNGKRVVGTYPPASGTTCPSSTSIPTGVSVVESFRERSGLNFSNYCASGWSSFWVNGSTNCSILQSANMSNNIATTFQDTGIGIQYNFTAAGTYTFSYDFVVGSPLVPPYDHLEIRHPGTTTLCPANVTVLACTSSTVPCPAANVVNTGTLTGSIRQVPGAPSITQTPSSFTLGSSASSATTKFQGTGAGTFTLSGQGLSATPLNGTRCWNTTSNTASCTFTVTNVPCVTGFECVETELTYNNLTTNPASRNPLYTQVSGNGFRFDVVALQSGGAQSTGYTASSGVTVELFDDSANPQPACTAYSSPVASQSITFSTGDNGRKTLPANFVLNNAYTKVRCRVSDTNVSVSGCSSDTFSVRPSSFTLSATANADATGASTTNTPVIRAGSAFGLTASTGVVGYNGVPQIDNNKIQAHTAAVQAGTVNSNFTAANATNGTATGSNFIYSEVGYFRFVANGVYDSLFTAVDSAMGDCATGFSAVGSKQACSFGNASNSNYFGRFIPDHFSITAGANTEGCDSGNFTYYGQDGLSTGFTLRAENSANVITQNYVGSFAKLGLTNWANYNFTSQGSPYSPELSASATVPTGTWVSGATSVTAKHQISRLSAMVPQSPKCADEYNFCSFSGTRTVIYGLNGFYTSGTFTNGVSCSNSVFGDPLFGTVKACYLANLPSPSVITVFARPTDSDGVTMVSAPVSLPSLFRYGRLIMPNLYGSELLPLSTTIEAQYWNGNVYQRNQLDSCSVIPANSIAMGNYRNNLTACETQISGAGTLNAGRTNANLTKPGAGNNGSVDLTINLNGASGSTCNSATASSAGNANMPWFGNNPNARATFGIFKTPVIYMRENF